MSSKWIYAMEGCLDRVDSNHCLILRLDDEITGSLVFSKLIWQVHDPMIISILEMDLLGRFIDYISVLKSAGFHRCCKLC